MGKLKIDSFIIPILNGITHCVHNRSLYIGKFTMLYCGNNILLHEFGEANFNHANINFPKMNWMK
jgi:hypothetical protein